MPLGFWYDLVWGPHIELNNTEFIDKDCLKGFIYSKEDKAIDYRDVEEHSDIAESKGYKTIRRLVEGAEHVQMFKAKGGENDYWGFIQEVWNMRMASHG
jgi:hypothetical protein